MRWDELCVEKVLKERSGAKEIVISMTEKAWPQGLLMCVGNLSMLETGVSLPPLCDPFPCAHILPSSQVAC